MLPLQPGHDGGVYEANGSNLFPVERLHSFPAADGIMHTRFFNSATAQKKLSEWMTADR